MANESNCGCGCNAKSKLIFACSGAADVGALSDQAARKMTRDGTGKMFCTPGIGGRVSGIMKTTEAADVILAIDGCPLDCVKQSLIQAGFNVFKHLRLTDIGFEKGKTAVNDAAVATVADKAAELLKD